MEILGVGPLEIIFILILAIIILGPSDMVKIGRTIGRFLRRIITSPTYHTVQETSHNLRTIPTRLMREAGLEESVQDLQEIRQNVNAMRKPISLAKDELEQAIGDTGTPGEKANDLSAWITPPLTETRTSSIGLQGSPAEPQAGDEALGDPPGADTPGPNILTDTPNEVT